MFANLIQLVEYRELLRTLVSKDIRSRYKGSVLGFAWNFAIPLLQLLVFWVLMSVIIKMTSPGDYPFAIFLFTGLLPWNFLANSLTGGAMSVVGNANLVKKIYFPLQVLPLTTVVSEFVSMMLGMIVLGVVVLAFGVGFGWQLMLLPLPFAVQLLFILGLTYFFASAEVFYRDVQHILGIIVMAWMYLTPILYPISRIADKGSLADIGIHLNPMTGIITAYQSIVLDHAQPDWPWFAYSTAAAALIFMIGFAVFNRSKYRFEEEI